MRSLAEMPCPVARTLDVVGEWWTLLIVRDAFRGARRFEDFRSLGAADNILSARLRRLVDAGVMEKRAYQQRPERFEYLLTDKGRDLLPVLGALGHWGQTWTEGANKTLHLTHSDCGQPVVPQAYCAACDRAVGVSEILPPATSLRPAATS